MPACGPRVTLLPAHPDQERRPLSEGLARLGIDADGAQLRALLDHLALIRRWSRAYNLVGARELERDPVTRHILDSAALLPRLAPGRVLDVGSGAGFPGLTLAILDPAREVFLLDSAGKKVRFLRHAVRDLGLANARAVHERVERFSPGLEFSTITSRAFGSLRSMAEAVRHLATDTTRLLALKGRVPQEELDDLPGWAKLESVARLEVPGLQAERHLVTLSLITGAEGGPSNPVG